MAMHEAGHAVVAIKLGLDVLEIKIGPIGGYCTHFRSEPEQDIDCYTALGGYFAVALYCREETQYLSWDLCSDDIDRFNRTRKGCSFRNGRKEVLRILRENKETVLALVDKLMQYGYVDHSNAGDLASDDEPCPAKNPTTPSTPA